MITKTDLTSSVTAYLTDERVACFFRQMGADISNQLTPSEYQAYLKVITWSVIEKLKATDSFPISQLTDHQIEPIVNQRIKGRCTIVPRDLGYPDSMPSCLLSRIIWWSLKLSRQKLR